MEEARIKVPFTAPLNPLDTETQTWGCRQNNPDICGNNMLEGICAFCREDKVCKKPSRVWKKQYQKLKGETPNEQIR